MRKFISIIIAIVMVLSLTATAFADGNNGWYIYGEADYAAMYTVSDEELRDVRNTCAEALEKAYGYAAFYEVVETLQANGIYLTDYKVIKEKTANYVWYLSVIDSRNGNTWGGIFAVYTHWGSQKVMETLQNGKKVPFLAIFLTDYVENQKINDYEETQQITAEETTMGDAIEQFVDFMNHYEERYPYFYGDDDYWDEDYEYWYDPGYADFGDGNG